MKIDEIKQAFAREPEAVAIGARQRYNCEAASVDDDGDVWIEDPMRGHWLDDDGITELAEWIEAETGQALADWAKRA